MLLQLSRLAGRGRKKAHPANSNRVDYVTCRHLCIHSARPPCGAAGVRDAPVTRPLPDAPLRTTSPYVCTTPHAATASVCRVTQYLRGPAVCPCSGAEAAASALDDWQSRRGGLHRHNEPQTRQAGPWPEGVAPPPPSLSPAARPSLPAVQSRRTMARGEREGSGRSVRQ